MIEFIIKRRKITLLCFVIAIAVGIFSFIGLPRQEMPDIIVKQAIVTTVYPGATPEKVEQTVTKIIEQKIKEIQDIKTITSTSKSGVSTIVVETEDDADASAKWDELRKKVQDAQADLPDDAHQPVINDNLTKAFIKTVAIYADTQDEVNSLHEQMITWKDQLRTVDGVSDVTIDGIPEQEIRFDLDMQKLAEYGIAWSQVVQAVQAENDRVPTGSISYDDRTYQLTVPQSQETDGLRHIMITRTSEGVPVYLSDVGTAKLAFKDAEYLAYYNGKPALTITMNAETGSDASTMDRNVSAKLDQLAKTLPAYAHMDTSFAQKDRVNELFTDLLHEMLIAIAAVIIICTLGLNMVTSSFVALAIPISIALGLIFMPMFGVTLNQISIIGLIIVLGILVDDAVVVNDNIERRLTLLGESPAEAALKGTKEVSLSILTATLATITAFVPLMFLQGDVGAFIKPVPFVITVTMLASLVMSLTIIPIFREWYEKRRGRKRSGTPKPSGLLGKQIQSLTNVYSGKWIPKILQRPMLTAMTGLLISTAAYGLVFFTDIELFPDSESPQATINVELPVGTSFEKTDEVIRDMAAWIEEQPETEQVAYATGGAAPKLFSDITAVSVPQGPTTGQLTVLGVEGKFDREQTVKEWREALQASHPEASVTISVPRLGIPVGSPISIRLAGEDIDQLEQLAGKVKDIVASTEGTLDIKDDVGIEQYSLNFEINQAAMDRYQVTAASLTQALLLMGEGVNIGEFDTGSELIDMNVYMNDTQTDPQLLFQQLTVTNNAGKQIPLSQLAEMKPDFSIQQIKHYNLERTITVEANLDGRTATDAMQEINAKLTGLELPDGYTLETAGETSEQADIFASLGKLYIIVICLIFLLIAMQFYSFSTPIIIMTTIYLAAAGGIIGIFVTGMPIGFMSITGIISLAGIVVRNGIVLIEFIEDARREGTELKEAVIHATAARFRPIVLTSFTALVGMLPIAFLGDILFRPMAMTIIFGLLFSTVLTLFVVPSFYMVVATWKLNREARKTQSVQQPNHTLPM